MDQSVSRTQYNTDAIRKFKRMSAGAALVMLLLLLRGDRGGGGESSGVASAQGVGSGDGVGSKSVDFEAASRDATEATNEAAAAAAQLVGTLPGPSTRAPPSSTRR